MAGYSVIADVSNYLLALFKEAAVGQSLLVSKEQIALGAPGSAKNDAHLLLYLYSIRDYAEFVPDAVASPHSSKVANKPLPITLQYIAYFNTKAQTPLDGRVEQSVLGKIMQALHTNSTVNIVDIHAAASSSDEPATILFSKLDDHEKHEIWSGFSETMRPAIYFEVGPLMLSAGERIVPRVKEMEGDVGRI